MATLLVIEVRGTFQVKIISARPIETATPILALPAPVVFSAPTQLITKAVERIISPYHDLAFFMSQPTRAPSF